MFKIYFLLPIVLFVAWRWPRLGGGGFRRIGRLLDRLAVKPGRAVFAVGLIAFVVYAAMGIAIRIPEPHTHDEFGYLLIADTFAHGRVSNSPHPLWQHFESVHVIQQPTYASKYPPAQGLALGFGEIAALPIVGIWLTAALASATMCWMLFAWMRPRWAAVGGLMTAFHPQMLVWSQSYWGGAIAVAGGAIVLGAYRRLVRQPRGRDAFWMGIGMAILANSRPYEGFVFCGLICLSLLVWALWGATVEWRAAFVRSMIPLGAVLAALALELGYYNNRVTGSPLRLPYAVCEDTYGIAPLFLFQSPKPIPPYRHAEIAALQLEYLRYFESQRQSVITVVRTSAAKLYALAQSALWGRLLVIPLLLAPWALRSDRWLRQSVPIAVVFCSAMLLGTWVFPHYAAPAAGLFGVLTIVCLRQLNALRWPNRYAGACLLRGTLLLCAGSSALTVVKIAKSEEAMWSLRRADILRELKTIPGEHLLFVHYQPSHNPNREWVYNSAEIDSAKVVLARIMSPEKNAELCEYFGKRKWWVVDADAAVPKLVPLEQPAQLSEPVSPDAILSNFVQSSTKGASTLRSAKPAPGTQPGLHVVDRVDPDADRALGQQIDQ